MCTQVDIGGEGDRDGCCDEATEDVSGVRVLSSSSGSIFFTYSLMREGRREGRQAATALGTNESTALDTVSVKVAAVGPCDGEDLPEGAIDVLVVAFSVGDSCTKSRFNFSIVLAFSVGDRGGLSSVSGRESGRGERERTRFGEGAQGELVGDCWRRLCEMSPYAGGGTLLAPGAKIVQLPCL